MEWLTLYIVGFGVFFVTAYALIYRREVRMAHALMFAVAVLAICAANIRPDELHVKGMIIRNPGGSSLKKSR